VARYSAGALTTAGSTLLPIISIYAGASAGGALREVQVWNTTSSMVALKLVRLTSTGTQGAGLTRAAHNPNALGTANCTAFNTHSANPTLGNDLGYRCVLGPAQGAAAVWTFGDTGIVIATGVANGIGVIVENGTGQACQATLVWDE